MQRFKFAAAAAAFCTALAAGSANAGVVIIDHFDSSITKAANGAQMIAAIEAVTNQYSLLYANPVTINIYFQAKAGAFLGASQSSYYQDTYQSYEQAAIDNALLNPTNAPLVQGLNSISKGPSLKKPYIVATGADFRANGYGGYAYPGAANNAPGYLTINGLTVDSIITLSTSYPIDYDASVPAYNGHNLVYNGRDVIEHEVDEALGIGGSGSMLNFGNTASIAEGVLDRFRYQAPGVISYSTNAKTNAYFSLDDGKTSLAAFNQISSGDFGDLGPTTTHCGAAGGLGGPVGDIQDAFTCYNQPTVYLQRGGIEDIMLRSIGWDPTSGAPPATGGLGFANAGALTQFAPVPEPATWTMLVVGTALIGFAARRRSAVAAFAV